MDIPDTHYARSADGLQLADQQWGDGPRLLIIPALLSKVELDWTHELIRRCREHLGRHLHHQLKRIDGDGRLFSASLDAARAAWRSVPQPSRRIDSASASRGA